MKRYTLWVETFTGRMSTDAGVHAEREYMNDDIARKEMGQMAKSLLATSTRVDFKIACGERIVTPKKTITQRNRPEILAWDEIA